MISICLHRLDPKTGERLSETRVDSRDPETGTEPQDIIRRIDMDGALPDGLPLLAIAALAVAMFWVGWIAFSRSQFSFEEEL